MVSAHGRASVDYTTLNTNSEWCHIGKPHTRLKKYYSASHTCGNAVNSLSSITSALIVMSVWNKSKTRLNYLS